MGNEQNRLIDSQKQNQIIQLALSKGLLSEADIDLIEESRTLKIKPDQNRLDYLMEMGLLNSSMLDLLEKDLEKDSDSNSSDIKAEDDPFATHNISLNDANKKKKRDTLEKQAIYLSESHPHLTDGHTVDFLRSTRDSLPNKSREVTNRKFGRYQLSRLLGEGGMGSVFLAYDPALKRYVALKFLHDGDPESVRRLLMEGRAQAKIEHPNICRVYEVDKIDDQLYIAMQYIDGSLLLSVFNEMTLEQKVKTIADAAEGLHAAHKEGLIHRDIKPQNIMVEKTDTGQWKPYIMDFGLVREISSKGITMTGEVLGTPCYMAPEQARGKTNLLDRRTDVYSLGATLYELLSGQPPFEGTSVMEVLTQVLNTDAKPLREVVPTLPIDLETIVMKCLDKDPSQRYDSAKALAEDLTQYLEGEPISGKRASLRYRVHKYINKHKAVFAVGTIALMVIIVSLSYNFYARWQYSQRLALSKQFNEYAADIENVMRHGHMMPLHDISREENLVKRRMNVVQEAINKNGAICTGPGNYALGRGYLALGDNLQALDHLQKAWNSGYQEREVAFALGITFGKLYQERLAMLDQQTDNRDAREAERMRAEKELKEVALRYLELGQGLTDESAEYVNALLAFYDRKWESALRHANVALADTPWLYEAKSLMGDTYFMMGREQLEKRDFDNASQAFENARAAYEETILIGESDVRAYEGLANLWLRVIALKFYNNEEIMPPYESLVKSVDKGLQANPRWVQGHIMQAQGEILLGQYQQIKKGESPLDNYDRAINDLEKLAQTSSNSLDTYSVLGFANLHKGVYLTSRNEDPSSALDLCIKNYKRVIELNARVIDAYLNIGNAYLIKVQYELNHGIDPSGALKDALANVEMALSFNSESAQAHSTLALLHAFKADYQFIIGEDSFPTINESIQHFNKAIALQPQNVNFHSYLGRAYCQKARYQWARGESPDESFDNSFSNFRIALTINGKLSNLLISVSSSYWWKALVDLERGEDPSANIDQCINFCKRALEINSKLDNALTTMGSVYLIKAEYLARQKEDATKALSQAMYWLDQSQQLNPNEPAIHFAKAVNYQLASYILFQRNQNLLESTNNALKEFDDVVHLFPKFSMGFQGRARSLILRSQQELRENRNPLNTLNEAEHSIKSALAINQSYFNSHDLYAEIYLRRAQWLDRMGNEGEVIKHVLDGMNELEKSFASNSNAAHSYFLRGALLTLQSRWDKDTLQKEKRLKFAQDAFDKALSLNRLLAIEVEQWRKEYNSK